jgi:copper chaperone CopZ
MKQTLAFLSLMTLFVTSFTFAADAKSTIPDGHTATLTIAGMHCGGCKKIITKSVCEDVTLASSFQSCEITNLDTKKQIGTMVIKYKKEASVNIEGIEKAIHNAGDYKITKKEISSQVSK